VADGRDAARQRLDRALESMAAAPTGRLLGRAPITSHFERYDGSDPAAPIAQSDWEQCCVDLERIAVPGATPLASIALIRARAAALHEQRLTPIAVIDARYNVPGERFLRQFLKAAGDDAAAALDEAQCSIATAIAPRRVVGWHATAPVHDGLRVTFVLDSSLYFSNVGERPPALDIDFADGRGYQSVAFGATVTVDYADASDKPLRYRWQSGNNQRHAASTLRLRARDAAQPDATWPLQATITYQGQANAGTAYVFYGTEDGVKHAKVTHPVLFLHPLTKVTPYSADDWMGLVGSLVDPLLKAGSDVILLSPALPGDYIQRSAFVAVECLNQIAARRAPGRPVAVVGLNVGAVVSRYALAYMEQHSLDHGAAYYVSLDGPHQGMNIALSLQWMLGILATEFEVGDARDMVAMLTSTAALQVLYYRVTGESGEATDPLHIDLLADLQAIGYPQKTVNAGISTGTRDGLVICGYAATAMNWHGGVGTTGYLLTGPAGGGVTTQIGECFYIKTMKTYSITVQLPVAYDQAPGSKLNGFGQLAEKMAAKTGTGTVDHPIDFAALVPTVSAIDWTCTTPYTAIANAVDTNPSSPFDLYVIEPQLLQQPSAALDLLLGVHQQTPAAPELAAAS
jgi:hypothetical protein